MEPISDRKPFLSFDEWYRRLEYLFGFHVYQPDVLRKLSRMYDDGLTVEDVRQQLNLTM